LTLPPPFSFSFLWITGGPFSFTVLAAIPPEPSVLPRRLGAVAWPAQRLQVAVGVVAVVPIDVIHLGGGAHPALAGTASAQRLTGQHHGTNPAPQ